MRRLLAERAAQLQIEAAQRRYDGRCGVGEIAASLLADGKDGMQANLREASTWVQAALKVLRTAPDATWPDDEAAAGEVLQQIEARRASQRSQPR